MNEKNPYFAVQNELDADCSQDKMPRSGAAAPPTYNPTMSGGFMPAVQSAPMTVTNIQAGPSPFQCVSTPPVGPNSMELQCPYCRCCVKTRVRHRATSKTHIACLLLSWTCCLCCLPYCMDSCQNTNHFCPMCQAYIGSYQS